MTDYDGIGAKGVCASNRSFLIISKIQIPAGKLLAGIILGVPGRTRTVDIQNHKHFYELFDNPFVHRSFRRLRKPVLRRFCGDFSYEFNNAGSNFLYKFSVFYCFYYVIFIFSNSQLQGISEGFFKLSFAAFLKLQQGDNPIRFFLGFC